MALMRVTKLLFGLIITVCGSSEVDGDGTCKKGGACVGDQAAVVDSIEIVESSVVVAPNLLDQSLTASDHTNEELVFMQGFMSEVSKTLEASATQDNDCVAHGPDECFPHMCGMGLKQCNGCPFCQGAFIQQSPQTMNVVQQPQMLAQQQDNDCVSWCVPQCCYPPPYTLDACKGCPFCQGPPKCNAPVTTGYDLQNCATRGGSLTAAACNVVCDAGAGYTGTPTKTCYGEGGDFVFTSCEAAPRLTYLGANPITVPIKLALCQGDCDSDGDCQHGLKCFQRTGACVVPGCSGTCNSDETDYCVSA